MDQSECEVSVEKQTGADTPIGKPQRHPITKIATIDEAVDQLIALGMTSLDMYSPVQTGLTAFENVSIVQALAALAPELIEHPSPSVVVAGCNANLVAKMEGRVLALAGRALPNGRNIAWTICSPRAPKTQRCNTRDMLLQRPAKICRTAFHDTFQKLLPLAQAVLFSGMPIPQLVSDEEPGFEDGMDIVLHKYMSSGQPLLWQAESELQGEITRQALLRCGCKLDAPYFSLRLVTPGEHADTRSHRMMWLRSRSGMDLSVYKANIEIIKDLYRAHAMLNAAAARMTNRVHRIALLCMMGQVDPTPGAAGKSRQVLIVNETTGIDIDTGEYLHTSQGKAEFVVAQLPASALALFPDAPDGDPLELRVQRLMWACRHLEEAGVDLLAKPSGPQRKDRAAAASVPAVATISAKAAEPTPPVPVFHSRVPVFSGKGTCPVLSMTGVIAQKDTVSAAARIRAAIVTWAEQYGFTADADAVNQSLQSGAGELTIEAEADAVWALRVNDRRFVDTGAIWRVEITLMRERCLVFGLRVSQVRLDERAPQPRPSVPLLVHELVETMGLRDGGRELTCAAWPVAEGEVDALLTVLQSSTRALPLVALVADEQVAHTLSRRLAGIAHVVQITVHGAHALRERLGKALAPSENVARIYYPGFGRGADPSTVPWIEGESREDAAAAEVCAWSVEPARADDRAPDFAQVRETIMARRVDRALENTRRKAASNAEQRDAYEHALQRRNQEVAALKERVAEMTQRLANFERETVALKRERDDARDAYRTIRHKHEQVASALSGHDIPVVDEIEQIQYPQDWSDLEAFCEVYAQGRLVLTPQAARAARASNFTDIPYAYQVLDLLANYYVPMKLRDPDDERPRHRYEQRLTELGAEVSGVGTAVEIARYAREYRRTFEGKTYTMDMHVKRQGAFNGTNQFRCYFAWDADNARVIVGSLPSHLTNRMS